MAARSDVVAGFSFIALWGVVVANLALRQPALRTIGEALLCLLIALALLRASRHIRLLASVLLLATAALAWRAGDWRIAERGLGGALAVGAFLPVIVLLRASVEASPAIAAIRTRVSAMAVPERRAWMTGGAHLVGSILTLGYVSVMRPMLPESLDASERMAIAECGVRGLGLAITWSPFFVASAVASQLVPQAAPWQLVLVGLGLAGCGALIAHVMFNRSLGPAALARALRRLAPIVLPTVLLVGAVVGVGTAAGWNALQAVIVVIPVVCFGYLLATAPGRLIAVANAVVRGAGRMGDELLILVASTVFGAAIAGFTPPAMLDAATALLSPLPGLLIGLEVLLIAGLGLLGLHPMVTASVLVPYTLAAELPIAAAVLAQIVVLGWSVSSMAAPWTLPVVVTATSFGIPVRRLVLGPNLGFVAVFALAGSGLLTVVNAYLMS
ncbi:MAG: hypothetical protein AB7G13_02410 [Lautropia sp.]